MSSIEVLHVVFKVAGVVLILWLVRVGLKAMWRAKVARDARAAAESARAEEIFRQIIGADSDARSPEPLGAPLNLKDAPAAKRPSGTLSNFGKGAKDTRAAAAMPVGAAIYAPPLDTNRNARSPTAFALGPRLQSALTAEHRLSATFAPASVTSRPKVTASPTQQKRSPELRPITRLSIEQRDFLMSQGIPLSACFDATGLRKAEYRAEMQVTGQKFAYGTKPCARGGHTIRSRAGHCIQCHTSIIAYARRHHLPGYVYFAQSRSKRLMKVGTTTKHPTARERQLRQQRYGDGDDWKILASAYVENGGNVEFAAQDRLRQHAVDGEYVKAGRMQACYELFRCSYDEASAAFLSSLPPGTKVRVHN